MIELLPEPPPPPRQTLPLTVVWTVAVLSTFLVVGSFAQALHLAGGLWLSELLFAAGAIIGFQLLGLAPWKAVGLGRFEPRALGAGLVLGAVNYLAWAVPLMALAQAIFPRHIIEMFDASQIFDRHSPVDLAIVLLGVSIAAPLGEELMFRGVMQRGLALHAGAPRAIVVTAVVFSAFHLDPVGFLARFELGVLFGLLAWKSGSLWPAIGAHAANNAVSSLLFLSAGDAKEEDLVWWVPVVMFAVGNAVLWLVVKGVRPWLQVAEPAQEVPQERNVPKAVLPWLAVAMAMVVAVGVLDWRGVALNVIDLVEQVKKPTRQREDVKAMRKKARAGEVGFERYRELLKDP